MPATPIGPCCCVLSFLRKRDSYTGYILTSDLFCAKGVRSSCSGPPHSPRECRTSVLPLSLWPTLSWGAPHLKSLLLLGLDPQLTFMAHIRARRSFHLHIGSPNIPSQYLFLWIYRWYDMKSDHFCHSLLDLITLCVVPEAEELVRMPSDPYIPLLLMKGMLSLVNWTIDVFYCLLISLFPFLSQACQISSMCEKSWAFILQI